MIDKERLPLVSICCQTYNHVSYIRECIEGFLLQQTTFPIEILIHDDASLDGTDDIIREYETNYPDLIFPIYQSENQYSKGVKVPSINYERSRGKYIAFCEGDDYWTDPLKLQKQVDFLESHSEYGMCSHKYQILKDGVLTELDIKQHSKNKEIKKSHQFDYIEYGRNDNLYIWYTQPLTLVFRKTLLNNRPKGTVYYYNDVSLTYDFLTTSKGAFALLDAGVYRKHSQGICSSLSPLEYYIRYQHVYEEIYKRNPDDIVLKKICFKHSLMISVIRRNLKDAIYYSAKIFPLDPKYILFFVGGTFKRCVKRMGHSLKYRTKQFK